MTIHALAIITGEAAEKRDGQVRAMFEAFDVEKVTVLTEPGAEKAQKALKEVSGALEDGKCRTGYVVICGACPVGSDEMNEIFAGVPEEATLALVADLAEGGSAMKLPVEYGMEDLKMGATQAGNVTCLYKTAPSAPGALLKPASLRLSQYYNSNPSAFQTCLVRSLDSLNKFAHTQVFSFLVYLTVLCIFTFMTRLWLYPY